ncbi:hypothetical protein CJ030_MR2G024074 [Morella rubra]|nr:hypothetical protein CJ030_MR2G024074 [Morella rubra]
MGNIDDAVPFFGKGFNNIYPLFMVIYTLLIASNFFDRVIEYLGNWKIFQFQNEKDDMDGFDQSGVMILQKERSGLEQGHKIGEHVIPLARNFSNISIDIESGSTSKERVVAELKVTDGIKDGKRVELKPLKEEALIETNREAIKKQTAVGEHKKNIASSTADANRSEIVAAGPPSGLASKWEAMKSGFQNLKSNIDAKRFSPSRQVQETKLYTHVSSSESLDEIFQRLKQPTAEHRGYDEDADSYLYYHGMGIGKMGPFR